MAALAYVAQGVPTVVYVFRQLGLRHWRTTSGANAACRFGHNKCNLCLPQGCARRSGPAKPFTGAAWRVQRPSRSS